MEAKLSQVLKSELVANLSIPAKQLHEAVLTDPKPVEDSEAPTTHFALGSEFVVHTLECHFEQLIVLRPCNEVAD